MEKLKVDWENLEYYENEILMYQGIFFTGIAVKKYPLGELRSEIEYINGLESGWKRQFYKSGQLREEEHYIRTILDGRCRQWYENGQIKSEELVEEGIVVWSKEWDDQGNLINEFNIDETHPLFNLLQIQRQGRIEWLEVVKDWQQKPLRPEDFVEE